MSDELEPYKFYQKFMKEVSKRGGSLGAWQVRGSAKPEYAGNYSTKAGKNIVKAYNNDPAWRSNEVLSLMAEINRAYHNEDWDEFEALEDEAERVFSKRSFKALSVYEA